MNTFFIWIDTTILNMTHVRDGNEIVPIKETPYNKIGEFPRLPTRV